MTFNIHAREGKRYQRDKKSDKEVSAWSIHYESKDNIEKEQCGNGPTESIERKVNFLGNKVGLE